jgi:site-specific DNA recombinase
MFKSNDGDQLIRVATYARVSTQEQATENTSMASQEGQLTAYCQMRGWTIINSYVDPGFTGKNGDRPGLKQLLADARIGLFDKVLVCKLDRLARSLRLLMDVEAELKEYEVSLTSIRESVDTSNGTGKMVFQLFGMVAEWDRDNIIERCKNGRIQRYKSGCWAGGKPTFGYSYDKTTRKLVINEDQAKIVRLIFNGYNSGKSIKAMNRVLDDQRIPTIRGKARGWIDSGIRFILINPIYKGTLIVSRNCHITDLAKTDLSKAITINVPAIVSESVWSAAQNRLRTNRKLRPPNKHPWLLQGLITCGQCGLSYQGQFPTRTNTAYACRGRLRDSHTDGSPRCNGPTLIAKWLEDQVWMKISDILTNPDKLREVIQESLGILKGRQAELDSILKPINEKLVDLTDKKAKLADQWVITNMEPEKYRKLQSNLNKEETRLKSLRANMDPSRLAELETINTTLQYWHDQFQHAAVAGEGGCGVNVLEKIKPAFKIYGFEDIEPIENIMSITAKRQILNKLQINLIVFKDCIEIRCQIPIAPEKSVNAILNLEMPLFHKHRREKTGLNL